MGLVCFSLGKGIIMNSYHVTIASHTEGSDLEYMPVIRLCWRE